MKLVSTKLLCILLGCFIYSSTGSSKSGDWLLVDNFEISNKHNTSALLPSWFVSDVQNETNPFVSKPQVALVVQEDNSTNHYYLKKPAKEGVIGNRKALSYKALPIPVPVGATYTFYTRLNVESFPNNHSFGLSNMSPLDIDKHNYNAFEPMLRVTDKTESNGEINSGALMVISHHSEKGKAQYSDIVNPVNGLAAKPLTPNVWYQVWFVVNNARKIEGGQTYDVYVQGGEFTKQQKVFTKALFRVARSQSLTHFITIANTGPSKQPYGNGGLKFDDIYMGEGLILNSPNPSSIQ